MTVNDFRPAPEGDEIDLLALWGTLWGGRKIIAGATLAAGLAGSIYAHAIAPMYTSEALLQLELRSDPLALPEGIAALAGDVPKTATEMEIIRSRMVLGAAAASAHLDVRSEFRRAPLIGEMMANYGFPLPNIGFLRSFARPGDTAEVELLEVPRAWVSEDITVTVGEGGAYVVELPSGEEISASVGEVVTDEGLGFSLSISSIEARRGRVLLVRQLSLDATIGSLRGGLELREQGRGSEILRLSFTHTDPSYANRALDAIVTAYANQNAERSAAQADSGLSFLQTQLPQALDAVRGAEAALAAAQRERGAEQLALETQALFEQVAQTEAAIREIQEREVELAQLYTRSHPEYRALIESRERLEFRLEELQVQVSALPEIEREIINLNRDLEIAQEIYLQLRNRAQELQVVRASNIGNVRIIDYANPIGATSPSKSRIVALALILGAVGGAGFVFFRNMGRDTIRSADAVEAMGMPVLASINRSEIMEGYSSSRRHEHMPLIAVEYPDDVVVEGFRSLRTGLHFGMLDAATRSVAITGTAPGVGKSFVCANLATVAAQSGQSVCIIDADMRRGTQRKYFGMPRDTPGLSDILSGNDDLSLSLYATYIPTLNVITAGQVPPNPSELLMRDTFAQLIEHLNDEYDLIIVDTPPVLAVTDPVIVSRVVGATVSVVRYDVTTTDELAAVAQTLKNAGSGISGVILNGFDPNDQTYGRYSRYAYSYRYEYRKGDDD